MEARNVGGWRRPRGRQLSRPVHRANAPRRTDRGGPARRLTPGTSLEGAMTLEPVPRYERISPKAYEHPADRAATSALKAVPLMDRVLKRLTDLGHERRFRQVIMGSAVKLGPTQIPEVWQRYEQAVSSLDLSSVPDLYVTNTPLVNAMTVGAHTPIVVVNSALLGSYSASEVQTVLAHECGHVLSEHHYYTTALLLLNEFLRGSLPGSL